VKSGIALLVLAACGNGVTSNAGNSISGTIAGQSYSIDDAVSARVTLTDGATGQTYQIALVLMGDISDLCANLDTGNLLKSFRGVSLEMVVVGGATPVPPSAPGTFTIDAGPRVASMNTIAVDAMCQPVGSAVQATAGTVTLSSLSGDVFKGAFDVEFGGDHVTGHFSPEACPALQAFASGMLSGCP